MSEPILQLRGVTKDFGTEVITPVLRGVDLRLSAGELVALIGPSGSGKSTLLNLLGLLDRPTSGGLELLGQDTTRLDDGALTRLRGRSLGFVFQFHHLIAGFTASENVALPRAALAGRMRDEDRQAAEEMLRQVGLGDRLHHLPSQLSGGQQQRVAIARALVHGPALVLADEPTGNLDTHSADEVFELMRRFHRERGTTFLIVTHDPRLAGRCDRIVELVDGRIVAESAPGAPPVR